MCIIIIAIITLCCAHYNNNNNNFVLCAFADGVSVRLAICSYLLLYFVFLSVPHAPSTLSVFDRSVASVLCQRSPLDGVLVMLATFL